MPFVCYIFNDNEPFDRVPKSHFFFAGAPPPHPHTHFPPTQSNPSLRGYCLYLGTAYTMLG